MPWSAAIFEKSKKGPFRISQAYLASFFTPDLNSNLCMEAVGLGGSGGLDGK